MNKKYSVFFGRVMCLSFTTIFIIFGFVYPAELESKVIATDYEDNYSILKDEQILQTKEKEEKALEDMEVYYDMTRSELLAYKTELENKTLDENTYVDVDQEIYNINKALENGTYLYPYGIYEMQLLAYGIYREAGSYWLTDRHRDLVGCVYLNRKNQNGISKDLINPTFADIMNEEGQYPYKSWNLNVDEIPEYCFESAIRVLEYKVNCPENVIWQATFKQGNGVYETHKDSVTGIITYFCFS